MNPRHFLSEYNPTETLPYCTFSVLPNPNYVPLLPLYEDNSYVTSGPSYSHPLADSYLESKYLPTAQIPHGHLSPHPLLYPNYPDYFAPNI